MKIFSGTVVSDKMTKTIVVEVVRQWTHPVYKKTVKRTKKYKVHDPKEVAKIGDSVTFSESRPLSKTKRFLLKSVHNQSQSKTKS